MERFRCSSVSIHTAPLWSGVCIMTSVPCNSGEAIKRLLSECERGFEVGGVLLLFCRVQLQTVFFFLFELLLAFYHPQQV